MTKRPELKHGIRARLQEAGWGLPDKTAPAIGRLVLNPDVFEPAYAYLRERGTVNQGALFRSLLTPDDYKAAQHAVAQNILDTLSGHPQYSSDFTNQPLACRVSSFSFVGHARSKGSRMRQVDLRVIPEEIYCPGRLEDERAMLMEHAGAEDMSRHSRAVRWITVGTTSDVQLPFNLLSAGVAEFLQGAVMTLGPIQVEPQTETGQKHIG